ncbi:unnamed protein product [Caenorhabditis nigoni]
MSEPTKTSPGYPAVLLNTDSPIVSQPAPDPPAGYYNFDTGIKLNEVNKDWGGFCSALCCCCEFLKACRGV